MTCMCTSHKATSAHAHVCVHDMYAHLSTRVHVLIVHIEITGFVCLCVRVLHA